MARTNRSLGRPEQHWQKAEKFRELGKKLEEMGELEAAVTIRFYAAVHYVNAFLSESGIKAIGWHGQRTSSMANTVLAQCYVQYAELQEISEDARYGIGPAVTSELSKAKRHLEVVRRTVERNLNVV